MSTGEGPWDSSRLDWWRESDLDLILPKGEYGEKVRTLGELEAASEAPMRVAPTRRVWIHESLEGEARRLWGFCRNIGVDRRPSG